MLILSSPFVSANTKLLADQALLHRLPAITLFPHFARDGGLMGYGPNLLSYFRHAGILAARILQGGSPAETPIDRPAKFEFVLNLKTDRDRIRLFTHTLDPVQLPDGTTAHGCTEFVFAFDPTTQNRDIATVTARIEQWLAVDSAS